MYIQLFHTCGLLKYFLQLAVNLHSVCLYISKTDVVIVVISINTDLASFGLQADEIIEIGDE